MKRAVTLVHLPLALDSLPFLLFLFDPFLLERKAAAAAWTGAKSQDVSGKFPAIGW